MNKALRKAAEPAHHQPANARFPDGRRVKFKTDERFRWLDMVMATPGLTAAAYRIAYYFAHDIAGPEASAIFPKQETIASSRKISLTAAKDALRKLEEIGFIRRVTRAVEPDRRSTSYVLMWPGRGVDLHHNCGRKSDCKKGRISDDYTVGNPPIEPPLIEPTPLPEGRGRIDSTELIDIGGYSTVETDRDPYWHLSRDISQYFSLDDERRAREAPGSYPDDENFLISLEGDDYDDCPF
jgi:DNA-binding MarR family transcriptional regulator